MDPLTLGLIGGGIGALGSIGGAAIQGIFNSGQAQEQRDYETQMANTTYQRGEADLKAAGLNPVLAAGGATDPTPSVSAATISAPDIGGSFTSGFNSGVSSAVSEQNYQQSKQSYPVSFATLQQNLKNAELNGSLTSKQIDNLSAAIDLVHSQTGLTDAQTTVALQTLTNLQASLVGINSANSAAQQKVLAGRLDATVNKVINDNPFMQFMAGTVRGVENTVLGPIITVPSNLLAK